MENDDKGRTALHCLCSKRTLVEKEHNAMEENFPEVAHEAGHLQFSSSSCPSFNVVSLLLERYPSAVTKKDDE
eukprot:14708354-Ditylum_brightwellii.AAC.1